MKIPILTLFATLACTLALIRSATADPVHLKPLTAGMSARLGPQRALRLILSPTPPEALKKAPSGLTEPRYGVLTLGPKESPTRIVILADDLEGPTPRLWVDANANGDLTDDPPVEWAKGTYKGTDGKMYEKWEGGATVFIRYGDQTSAWRISFFRYDPADAVRALYKGSLLYFPDYAYEGTLTLGSATYNVMLVDATATGDFRGRPGGIILLIDVNGNGIFDRRGEVYDTALPFNIKGTTYEITQMSASGDSFRVEKSKQTVAEVPPPPDLRPGHKAPEFEAKTLDGKVIHFPSDYKGKLVVLVFYAAWCPDCRRELPDLIKVVENYRARGVETVGISLDKPGDLPLLTQFTTDLHIPWPQVYDGKSWPSALGQLYFVQATPTLGIVDGDTGEVIAFGDVQMSPSEVERILQKALAKRK